ncbi:MAG: thioredoxin family protein [Clostridiales bacterium]|jgi:small redox-active disulfide protein 2|nr:thioredoxin family protein [Clostridiales bacterium]
MAWFGRKEDKKAAQPQAEQQTSAQSGSPSVKVLGSGCARCNELEAATRAALQQLGMTDSIEHVTDFVQIASYGVMTTPALVVDGKLLSYGKVLKTDEVVKLLQQARG